MVNRPWTGVSVIFIDAIVVKVRDGQVRNKPIYVVIGVTVTGRDILGLWLGTAARAQSFGCSADRVEEPRRRCVHRVCDGLKGCRAINSVWELTRCRLSCT